MHRRCKNVRNARTEDEWPFATQLTPTPGVSVSEIWGKVQVGHLVPQGPRGRPPLQPSLPSERHEERGDGRTGGLTVCGPTHVQGTDYCGPGGAPRHPHPSILAPRLPSSKGEHVCTPGNTLTQPQWHTHPVRGVRCQTKVRVPQIGVQFQVSSVNFTSPEENHSDVRGGGGGLAPQMRPPV